MRLTHEEEKREHTINLFTFRVLPVWKKRERKRKEKKKRTHKWLTNQSTFSSFSCRFFGSATFNFSAYIMAALDDKYYKELYKFKKADSKLNSKIKTTENIRKRAWN